MMKSVVLFVAGYLISIASYAQPKERPYVVLVSFDGFRYDYVSRFKPPYFQEFIRKGAAAEGLIPSFPSKTFPNHYTLVTGLYPGRHGLVDNAFYDPALHQYYAIRDRAAVRNPGYYGGTPLWQLAQQQGLKTASFFWVGSEAAIQGKYPDYCFDYDESVPNKQRVDQTIAWLKLPPAERPHFISLYFSLVDTEGHHSGPNSQALREIVLQADSLLGHLMHGLKTVALPVNVILVSDHGMMELSNTPKTFVSIPNLFDTRDSSIVFVNGGTQTHIYTHKADSLYDVLKKKEYHFKVYKRKEMPTQWHYNHERAGDLLLVIEPGYYFQDQPRRAGPQPAVFGAHGFDPGVEKNMQGIFYAAGPNIKQRATLPPFENVHVYPFIATILGLAMPPIDGDPDILKEIYKKR
ncbi:ectonucleotide pyrophosphatase/phosphodiesterase [Fulvivirgaceae bacterium PWU5]|uniref:Ectonucleotide pyrophosphatase/phosphodiesterase n=1 Tax=Dawidia cretensis TaxID=2782350 RepID=A0AAP2DX98_9BACT|nr:ectonucleotide pyrophosphatase/phosphodiesterase [Dawidia cretensis]MBT1707717.1 ectonucleotide pyrophosphatase/phosphodiesterase [Dawidia cretensis]